MERENEKKAKKLIGKDNRRPDPVLRPVLRRSREESNNSRTAEPRAEQ